MELNKKYWNNFYFTKDKFPRIRCPFCNEETLIKTERTFFEQSTGSTREKEKYNVSSPIEFESIFTLMFFCLNEDCNEIVSCIGNSFFDIESVDYDENGYSNPNFIQCYYPKFFYPPLNIITLKKSYPQNIKKELIKSFSHFFNDKASCANKIRICIELLMDNFRVRKTRTTTAGKRKRLTLHERISEFKDINNYVSELLLAVKWLGNKGSHYENVSSDDILTAYEILDLSLTKLYDTREKEIKRIVKMINKTKGKKMS